MAIEMTPAQLVADPAVRALLQDAYREGAAAAAPVAAEAALRAANVTDEASRPGAPIPAPT